MADDIRFRIEGGYSATTIPMDRLAEYMAAWSRLVGEPEHVHFKAVENGSAVLRAVVDAPAAPKVIRRVMEVRSGNGPADALKAYRQLDEMLRADNATGTLSADEDRVIIAFPGRTRPAPVAFGPFRQDGTLDGEVIRVGGKDATVPVHLREHEVIHTHLHAAPALAREIAQHLLGPTIRVHGSAAWYRTGDGNWELRDFRITDFEVLNDQPLADVIAGLRAVRGSKWAEVEDPVAAILSLRNGDGGGS